MTTEKTVTDDESVALNNSVEQKKPVKRKTGKKDEKETENKRRAYFRSRPAQKMRFELLTYEAQRFAGYSFTFFAGLYNLYNGTREITDVAEPTSGNEKISVHRLLDAAFSVPEAEINSGLEQALKMKETVDPELFCEIAYSNPKEYEIQLTSCYAIRVVNMLRKLDNMVTLYDSLNLNGFIDPTEIIEYKEKIQAVIRAFFQKLAAYIAENDRLKGAEAEVRAKNSANAVAVTENADDEDEDEAEKDEQEDENLSAV